MPKIDIDYSKTVVYMICCKDPTIKDVYVGHTTSLSKRKAAHKYCCNTPKGKKYNLYVYEFIRENNGWNNWEMIVLETKSCTDGDDARKLERAWLEIKGATLNGCRPIISKEELLEQKKKYWEEHRDEILEQKKIYREEHIEQLKKYREDHREEHREQNKNYYQEHKDEINRRKRELYALKKSK